MTKEEIITEIKRAAAENGGKPLGMQRFWKLTGIPHSAWRGKYWRNWNSALEEAGLEKNALSKAYDDDFIIQNIVLLTRKNRQYPTVDDIKLEKRTNETFPGYSAVRRLGTFNKILELVREYVSTNKEYSDILKLLPNTKVKDYDDDTSLEGLEKSEGFVYMVKEQYSRQYKIGKTFDVPRRHREIILELPGDLKKIHSIRTDDPTGIEAYWHKRFENKRTNGEWFALTIEDIRAFKRRKFM